VEHVTKSGGSRVTWNFGKWLIARERARWWALMAPDVINYRIILMFQKVFKTFFLNKKSVS
jgi:glutathione peroxidase-family protein